IEPILFFSHFFQKWHISVSLSSLDFHTPYVYQGPCSFNGKEKDYESGFHYYGARYYWSELLTGWLSIDPMSDKYPSMSPYNYCAWNPVMLVDPDGNDFEKIVDHENKTITIRAQFVGAYTESQKKILQKVVEEWNSCSFEFSIPGEEGNMENYTVCFDINSSNGDGPSNYISFLPNDYYNKNYQEKYPGSGGLSDGINIALNNTSNSQVLAHEMGHCLGMDDHEFSKEGLMFKTNTGDVPTKKLGLVERIDILSACGFYFKGNDRPGRSGQCVNTISIGDTPTGFNNTVLSEKNLIRNDSNKFVK
ncbi:MAG: hypothetical protein K6E93_08175, partial [Bacteroidales bacterium]|nr:hypothetical protein [Bacteroidales bacterium]